MNQKVWDLVYSGNGYHLSKGRSYDLPSGIALVVGLNEAAGKLAREEEVAMGKAWRSGASAVWMCDDEIAEIAGQKNRLAMAA